MVYNVTSLILHYSSYFLDPSYVVLRGKPSASMADRLEKTEKARIAAQVKKLGPAGLAKAAKELEEAKIAHEKPIPSEVLTAFPVPDVRSISWIPVQSVQEPGKGRPPKTITESELSKHIGADGSSLQLFLQYDHVKVYFNNCSGDGKCLIIGTV